MRSEQMGSMVQRRNYILIRLQYMKNIGLLCTLIFFPFLAYADKRTVTTIIPHSPSIDAARELSGWENLINLYPDNVYGSIAINPEYTMSLRPDRIAQCFFGDAMLDYNNTFTVSGSRADRFDADWLADYFGLPTDFSSYISVWPRVSNLILDLDFFVGSAQYLPGAYFRVHAPLVYSKWELKLCETIITEGSNAHDPGYFNETGITRTNLVENFTQFITGQDAPKADDLTFNKLSYAKMSNKREQLTKLSDIQCFVGYNVLQSDWYHVGANLRGSIPTGNRPLGTFLFEPIIGNAHHWELGVGISTHIIVWHEEETDTHVGLYFDLNLTHMFRTMQHRSFDLCGSQNSRYMLAQRMGSSIENNLRGVVDGERVAPTVQYKKEVTPVANLTTIPINVTVALQTDLALLINYTSGPNSWSCGYGFWGRSKEKINLCSSTKLDTERWALKGDAHVFGFEDNAAQTAIALSATQSKATVQSGKNFSRSGAITTALVNVGNKNPNIDNPAGTVADSNDDGTFLSVLTQAGGTDQINTSIQPILLTKANIDIESAQTKSAAHKLFSHYTRTLTKKHPGAHAYPKAETFLGFGAEIELGPQADCPKVICLKKPACVNTALSFWAVWIKGSVAF